MSTSEEAVALTGQIEAQGLKIRELKAAKAEAGAIKAEVAHLLDLKAKYKEVTGEDFGPPPTAASSGGKKEKKSKENKDSGASPAEAPQTQQVSKKAQKKAAKEAESAGSGVGNAVTDPSVAPASTSTGTGTGPSVAGKAKTSAAVTFALEPGVLYLFAGGGVSATDTRLTRALQKCFAVAEMCGQSAAAAVSLHAQPSSAVLASLIPAYPALVRLNSETDIVPTILFGTNAICRYLFATSSSSSSGGGVEDFVTIEHYLDLEEGAVAPLLDQKKTQELAPILAAMEAEKALGNYPLALNVLAITLSQALQLVQPSEPERQAQFPYLVASLATVMSPQSPCGVAGDKLKAALKTMSSSGKKSKKDKSGGGANVSAGSGVVYNNDDVVKPTLSGIDWTSTGLMSSLKIIFDAAILAAFPQCADSARNDLPTAAAVITRCANPAFGDFQCNNAMALSKGLKGLPNYSGPMAPKDVAERILCGVPENPIVASTSCAPNGFINIKLSPSTLVSTLSSIINQGAQPPVLNPQKVLVDFSSPNIAKEMHVGHLRSTIIGDCVCRILEFCGFDVMRVNHVGDWGTQFGMLITYLQELYPDILTNPPNISDLTAIYKASKRKFDEDEAFKELSRLNVVKLQAGDPACKAIWTLLCDISRGEFQKVYDKLDVKLTEYGESFYNPMIPPTIEELQQLQLVQEDDGMLVIRLPHFTIPLIVRKSDGGYGYDSTDMAALRYRTQELQRDWLVYITDAGQAPHFFMCFDAAKECGWLSSSSSSSSSTPTGPESSSGSSGSSSIATAGTGTGYGGTGGVSGGVRVDHIGFGVVCGDDGKRFKTRSSETVRLIDLLDAAKDRMKASLQARAEEGKSPLQGEELDRAAQIIGFGAVKYFDLKQHPSTNYIFSYDRMLDTKGDTAVYLLFAYARLASILRKAKEEKNIDVATGLAPQAAQILSLAEPAERALAFELLQLGDVLKSVIQDLLPNRLCDYLKELAVKFTDFVTKCHVLNAADVQLSHSRLLLCEATRRVMAQCFSLLGIGTLERI